jgi:hypothetical protein
MKNRRVSQRASDGLNRTQSRNARRVAFPVTFPARCTTGVNKFTYNPVSREFRTKSHPSEEPFQVGDEKRISQDRFAVHNVGGHAIETVNRSLNSGDSLLKMVLCNSLIRQAMICPFVAASAGTKGAIEHTTVILPVLRKCAAEV